MAKQDINTLKNWFRRGLKPPQQQFWDWLDSFRHLDSDIPAAQVAGLQTLLDAKLDKKDAVDPDQVGEYDPLKNYVYDAAKAEYVSFKNEASSDPQFQVEGFYRLTENAPASENPETHAHWAYQGYTLGELTIGDVVGLTEALLTLNDTINDSVGDVTRNRPSLSVVVDNIDLDYGGKNQLRAKSVLTVFNSASLTRTNDSNAEEGLYFLELDYLNTLTFPTGTYMQKFEADSGRWDDTNREFTALTDGVYEITETKADDKYFVKISDVNVDS